MVQNFPKWEVFLYFFVYISYLVYGLNELLAVRDKVLELAKFQFSEGWPIINRPRDDSNDELENFSNFIMKSWRWYVLHLCASLSIRFFLLRRPGLVYAGVSVLFLLTTFQKSTVIIYALLVITYFYVSKLNSKIAVWVLSGIWIFLIHFMKNSQLLYDALGYEEYFILVVSLSWTMLRGCSFIFHKINDRSKKLKDLQYVDVYTAEHYLGYTLYFPTLIYGPFLTFKRYIVIESNINENINHSAAIWLLIKGLLRLVFWWFVLNLSLHFIYILYMERDIDAVKLIDNVYSQYAVGYFMGQYFFVYYVLTYGLGITIAKFDGLNPPQRPRCIGRVNFYSDMWRYFDEGLYEFLFLHIYAELCTKNSKTISKLMSIGATFAFIFVWHGCYMNVFIWTFLNYVCFVAEKIFKWFTSCQLYYNLVTVPFGYGISQRLRALLATQIFIPAAFSNVFFISGTDAGQWLMRGAYCSGYCNYLTLTFCCYCFFQCSEIISN